MFDPITVIELFPVFTDCHLCGKATRLSWGVPVCEPCYQKHELLSDLYDEYLFGK